MTEDLSSDNQSNAKRFDWFSLMWLDDSPESDQFTETKLRSIVNHFMKYQDVSLCQQYIENMSKDDRLVLIVSGRLGKKIVPLIHKLPQVSRIYVYCEDNKVHELWACQYDKVARSRRIAS